MCTSLEKHVQHIVQEIDCGKEEKADITEELLSHLQMAKASFIEKGHDETEAERLAINEFGRSDQVGQSMQEAMFPYRRLFFLVLAIASLVAAGTAYFVALLTAENAFFGWLIFSVITSSLLLLFTGQHILKLERKRWLLTTLIIHMLVFVYGYFIANLLNHWSRLPITYLMVAIILFAIFLIYRISLYDYSAGNKDMKVLHFINITLGFPYVGATLFFAWAALAFMEVFHPFVLIGLVPMIIWVIAYIVQIQLMKYQKKKLAYATLVTAIFLGILMVLTMYR